MARVFEEIRCAFCTFPARWRVFPDEDSADYGEGGDYVLVCDEHKYTAYS